MPGDDRGGVGPWEGVDAAAGNVLGYHIDGNVNVYDCDAEHEDGEGKSGCNACENGERDGDDEEEGHNQAVGGVEEGHDREEGVRECECDCCERGW